MTKLEFTSKRAAIKKYGKRRAWVWLLGMIVGGLLWSLICHDRANYYEHVAHDTDPLFATLFISYMVGGIALIIWLQFRHERKLGYFCPHCHKRFLKPHLDAVMATGKCGRCGGQILDEKPAAS
jgi:DNA-directed RNA polymerase subunit RPC12/RpoP